MAVLNKDCAVSDLSDKPKIPLAEAGAKDPARPLKSVVPTNLMPVKMVLVKAVTDWRMPPKTCPIPTTRLEIKAPIPARRVPMPTMMPAIAPMMPEMAPKMAGMIKKKEPRTFKAWASEMCFSAVTGGAWASGRSVVPCQTLRNS